MSNVLRTAAVIVAADLVIIAAGILGCNAVADAMTYQDLPVCVYEDGNIDGLPCLWIDRDTGVGYFNDGSNYRD